MLKKNTKTFRMTSKIISFLYRKLCFIFVNSNRMKNYIEKFLRGYQLL